MGGGRGRSYAALGSVRRGMSLFGCHSCFSSNEALAKLTRIDRATLRCAVDSRFPKRIVNAAAAVAAGACAGGGARHWYDEVGTAAVSSCCR